MLRKIPQVFQAPQPYLVTLYKAILLTAYFGLFRVGELTYSEYSDHVVKVKDVHIGTNKDKILFVLHTSKTHGRGVKPQQIKIKAARKMHDTSSRVINHVFPFQLIRDYLAVRQSRKDDSEQFFIFKDRTPVSANNYRSILKQTIQLIGLNPDLYQMHSTRTGCAIDLLEMGLSVETIKN